MKNLTNLQKIVACLGLILIGILLIKNSMNSYLLSGGYYIDDFLPFIIGSLMILSSLVFIVGADKPLRKTFAIIFASIAVLFIAIVIIDYFQHRPQTELQKMKVWQQQDRAYQQKLDKAAHISKQDYIDEAVKRGLLDETDKKALSEIDK